MQFSAHVFFDKEYHVRRIVASAVCMVQNRTSFIIGDEQQFRSDPFLLG
jgi:hypothetical protein